MDPIKIEKLRAMNKYKRIQFLQILFQYLLTALVLGICISKVLWFPSSLFSSVKLFFSVSIVNFGTFVANPKCLFVVCNAIVIFLVGESKLGCPSSSSSDIYDEFVRQSQSLRRKLSIEEKEKEKGSEVCLRKQDEEVSKQVVEEEEKEIDKGEKEEQKEKEKEKGGEELEEEEQVEEEVEEERIEADELNKRFEDFIARVNKRMRLEAQVLDCCG